MNYPASGAPSQGRGGRLAQASMEYLLILAAALVIITLLAMLAQGQMETVQKQKETSDIQNSLYDLSSAAREVYAQGEGSRKLVLVSLPSGYDPGNSSVGNKSIRIRAYGTDYVSVENFNVRGYLPDAPGRQWVWVISEGNRVRIGPAMMELSRNRIYLVMERSSSVATSFSVTNIWTRSVLVTPMTDWSATEVSMSGVPASFNLSTNGSDQIGLEFSSSENASGFYLGEIILVAADGLGASETVIVPVTVFVIGYDAPHDLSGPIITSMNHVPNPAVKDQPLIIVATASDDQTGNSTIISCELRADGAAAWQAMVPIDGSYNAPNETVEYNYASGFPLGMHSIQAHCTDEWGNTGPTAFFVFNVSEADQLGPIVIQMNHTGYPTTLSNISVGGIATDAYTGNSNLSGCMVKLNSGSWQTAVSDDGAWDSPTENFSYNVGPLAVGYYQVFYQCNDSVGNEGGIYNDSFGVVDVDLMLVLDRSGSMSWTVTNASNTTLVNTPNTGWTRLKNMTVSEKNGDLANLSVEMYASAVGCIASYEARINGNVVGSGNTTSNSYTYITSTVNVSAYEPPYDVALYVKRTHTSSCTAYNRFFGLNQHPIKMIAAKDAAKTFLDISGSATYAGLVSYSTSATTDRQLYIMNPANQQALKDAIDAMVPLGSTCIECGLENAANELTSVRGRPTSTRVIVLLTDGMGNVGSSIDGAVYCRDRNITVYTIGFGGDVDDTELTNIALLTNGDYYFAPNAETLMDIFMNIGK